MKIGLSTSVILNILLLAVILILRECSPGCPKCPESVTKTDSIVTFHVDTVKLGGKDHYYPVPFHIDTVKVTSNVDTSKIISEYLKVRKYNLPIMDDSNGKVNVFADVQYNRISKWTYKATFYPKTTIIEKNHILSEFPRAKVFVGFQTRMMIPENNMILAPTIALCTKRDHLYSLEYDPFNHAAGISVLWKIRLKK